METRWFFIFFLLELFSATCVRSQDWSDPLITINDPENQIKYEADPLFGGKLTIRVPEERKVETGTIVQVNYNGAAELTLQTDNKNWLIKLSQDGGKWYLNFLSTGDFDNDAGFVNVEITLTDSSTKETATTFARLLNLDDNAPLVTHGSTCTKKENEEGNVDGCTITIKDLDGCASLTKFKIIDSDLESPDFSIDMSPQSQYPDCLESGGGYDATATVKVNQALDYEEINSYFLHLQYTDSNPFPTDKDDVLVVKVQDMPDENPVWVKMPPTAQIDEMAPTTVEVQARDGDAGINAEICYSLSVEDVDSEQAGLFNIDPKSGLIEISAVDRDRFQINSYTLDVTASECVDPSSSITQNLIVQVRDSINQNLSYTITGSADGSFPAQEFNEGTVFSLKSQVIVTDPDEGPQGTFTATLDDSSRFIVLPTTAFQNGTFTIQSTTLFDYEKKEEREISLMLRVTESADPNHQLGIPIVVRILDVNDESPVFDNLHDNSLSFSVKENTAAGEKIGVISATDPDEGDVITYSIISNVVSIDSSTGVLSVKGAIDFESLPQIQAQVTATDSAKHSSYASVVIDVEDINDTPPVITITADSTVLVPEDAVVDMEVEGVTVMVEDRDTNKSLAVSINWEKSYGYKNNRQVDLSDPKNRWFELVLKDDTNAVLKVAAAMDWSNMDTLSLALTVTDDFTELNSNSQFGMLGLQISDVNNKAPVFDEKICETAGVFHLSEGADENQLVGSVSATDADGPGNNVIVYSLSDPDTEQRIKINQDTGVVTTGPGAKDVDYETGQSLEISVVADDGVAAHQATCKLLIEIEDVNDNAPVGVPDNSAVKVPEDQGSGQIFFIEGTDADISEPFRTITFSMNSFTDYFALEDFGNGSAAVSVKLAEGESFDYESANKQYTLTVVLTDNPTDNTGGKKQLQSRLPLTVDITDVNDNRPIFQKVDPDECFITVPESTQQSVTLTGQTKISATDKDSGDFGWVSYNIESVECVEGTNKNCPADKDALFAIIGNKDSAEANVLVDVQSGVSLQGKYGTYHVTVKAEDHGKDPLSATQVYSFCITDINDNAPIFVYPNDTITAISVLLDGSGQVLDGSTGKPMSNFAVTDDDFGVNARMEWTITPSDVFNLQRINDLEAALQVKGDLTGVDRTQVTLRACDSPTDDTQKCTEISVVLVPKTTNEVEPTFEQNEMEAMITENSLECNVTIYPATDKNNDGVDGAEKEAIYYYIIASEPVDGLNFFSLDPLTGDLSLVEKLDAYIHDEYNLTIQTSNKASSENLPKPAPESLLVLKITVEDINDKIPEFTNDGGQYIVSITANDEGRSFLTIEANDHDKDSVISYGLDQNSVESHVDNDDGLDPKQVFSIDPKSGAVKVVSYPKTATSGYYFFKISATDQLHPIDGNVTVYLISDQYLLPATFSNTEEQVARYKTEATGVFTEFFELKCVSGQLKTQDNKTTMPIYFQDENDKPILPDDERINDKRQNYDVINNLRDALRNRFSLELWGLGTDQVTDNTPDNINNALIGVSVALAIILIAFGIFYIFKTRRLNSLVEKLTNANADVSDKHGLTLPNANQHAGVGSNPVWNTEVDEIDRISTTSSDDSGLIGIEDNPEFQSFYNEVVLKAAQTGGRVSVDNEMMRDYPQLRGLEGLEPDEEMRY